MWSSPRTAAVDQDPQHRELLVVDHRPQPAHPGPDQRHRVRVGGVGLAALTGREDPRPCRELRRHVDDLLADGEQSHRDVVPDPAASLDRPDPVRQPADVAPHRGEPVRIGGEPATAQDRLVGGHHLDRGRPLVRVHPDHHTTVRRRSSTSSDARSITGCRAGRATLLRVQQTLLEPLLAQVRRPGPHRPNESHTTSVGSRDESDEPGRLVRASPGPVLGAMTTSSRDPRAHRLFRHLDLVSACGKVRLWQQSWRTRSFVAAAELGYVRAVTVLWLEASRERCDRPQREWPFVARGG